MARLYSRCSDRRLPFHVVRPCRPPRLSCPCPGRGRQTQAASAPQGPSGRGSQTIGWAIEGSREMLSRPARRPCRSRRPGARSAGSARRAPPQGEMLNRVDVDIRSRVAEAVYAVGYYFNGSDGASHTRCKTSRPGEGCCTAPLEPSFASHRGLSEARVRVPAPRFPYANTRHGCEPHPTNRRLRTVGRTHRLGRGEDERRPVLHPAPRA